MSEGQNKNFDLYSQAVKEFELKDVKELLEKVKSSTFKIDENLIKKLDKNDNSLSETEKKLLEQSKEALDMIKFLEKVIEGLEKKEKKEKILEIIDKTEKLLNKAQKESSNLEEIIKRKKRVIEQIKKTISENTTKIEKKQQELKQVQQKIKTIEEKIKNIKNNPEKKEELSKLQNELNTLNIKNKNILKEVEGIKIGTNILEQKLNTLENEISQLNRKKANTEKTLLEAGKKISTIMNMKANYKIKDPTIEEKTKKLVKKTTVNNEKTKLIEENLKKTKQQMAKTKYEKWQQKTKIEETQKKGKENEQKINNLEQEFKDTLEYIKYNPYNSGTIDYFNKHPEKIKNITNKEKLLEVLKNSKFENNDTNIAMQLKNTNNKKQIKPENYINSIFLSDPDVLNAFSRKFHTKFNASDIKDVNFEIFEKNKEKYNHSKLINKFLKLQPYEQLIKKENGQKYYNNLQTLIEKINFLEQIKNNNPYYLELKKLSKEQLQEEYHNLKKYEAVIKNIEKYHNLKSLIEKVEWLKIAQKNNPYFDLSTKELQDKYNKLKKYEEKIKNKEKYNKLKSLAEKIKWLEIAQKNFNTNKDFQNKYNTLKKYEKYISQNDIDNYKKSSLAEKVKKLEKIKYFEENNDIPGILNFISHLSSDTRINFIVKNYGEDQTKILLAKLKELSINDKEEIEKDLEKVLKYRNYKKDEITKKINELLVNNNSENNEKENRKEKVNLKKEAIEYIKNYIKNNKNNIDFKYLDNLIAKLRTKIEQDDLKSEFIKEVFEVLSKDKNNFRVDYIYKMPRFYYQFTNGSNDKINSLAIKKVLLENPKVYEKIFNIKQQQDFVLYYIDGLKNKNQLNLENLSNIKIRDIYQAKRIFKKLKEYGFKEEDFFKLINDNKISSEMNRIAQGINLDNFEYDKDIGDIIKIMQIMQKNRLDLYEDLKTTYQKYEKKLNSPDSITPTNKEKLIKKVKETLQEGKLESLVNKLDTPRKNKDLIINTIKDIINGTLNGENIDSKFSILATYFKTIKNGKEKFDKIIKELFITLKEKLKEKDKQNFNTIEKKDKIKLIKNKILNENGEVEGKTLARYQMELKLAEKKAQNEHKKFDKKDFDKKFIEKISKKLNLNNTTKAKLFSIFSRIKAKNHLNALNEEIKKGNYSLEDIINKKSNFWKQVDIEEKRIIINQINAGEPEAKAYIDPQTGEIKFNEKTITINNFYETKENTYNLEVNGEKLEGLTAEEIEKIGITKDKDGNIIIKNPDVLRNTINFYKFFKDLNLLGVWKYRKELTKSMGDININLEDDSLKKRELVKFGNKLIHFINNLQKNEKNKDIQLNENLDELSKIETELRKFSQANSMLSSGKTFNNLGEDILTANLRNLGIIGGACFHTMQFRDILNGKIKNNEGKNK